MHFLKSTNNNEGKPSQTQRQKNKIHTYAQFLLPVPARRYASAGICYGISICMSHACFVSKRCEIRP